MGQEGAAMTWMIIATRARPEGGVESVMETVDHEPTSDDRKRVEASLCGDGRIETLVVSSSDAALLMKMMPL